MTNQTLNKNHLVELLSVRYNEAHEKINLRRELWSSTIRDFVYEVLERIRKTANLIDLDTVKVLDIKNLESVSFGFHNANSGIEENTEQGVKSFMKYGGRLCFSQLYNGKIAAVVIYPFIETYVEQIENKILGVNEPNDIIEDLIVDYYEKFIEEIIVWETNDRKPVGY